MLPEHADRTPARMPEIVDLRGDDATDSVAQLHAGLLGDPACIAPTYFYDPLGARLFDAITCLDEYPLTRDEAALVRTHTAAIAVHIHAALDAAGGPLQLIDLGAGDGKKAAVWIDALQADTYVAVDIAMDGLLPALERLQQRHPRVAMVGVGCDFQRGLALPADLAAGRRVALYPGSSIGNFAPPQARAFLAQVRHACAGGGLLIGVDLVKSPVALERAYDDALGITAAFNRNVLRNVNRLLGADFDVADWGHRAFFNGAASRIEMHLEALRDVDVRWPGAQRRFTRGQRIHTENSYKWTVAGFGALLAAAGFERQRHWTDAGNAFAIFWAD